MLAFDLTPWNVLGRADRLGGVDVRRHLDVRHPTREQVVVRLSLRLSLLGDSCRVALHEEVGAAFGFVGLADERRGLAEAA